MNPIPEIQHNKNKIFNPAFAALVWQQYEQTIGSLIAYERSRPINHYTNDKDGNTIITNVRHSGAEFH